MSFVTHLESALDGTRYPARTLQTVHDGRPLWVRYDLDEIRRTARREALRERQPTMWRYREFLPIEDESQIVSLGEEMTPLIPCAALGERLGLRRLFIKDESRLPTGSFKARGMAMAVSMARALGVSRVAIPTAGNAGGALSAYSARAGMECFVFMPDDTPIVNQLEPPLFGARAFLVNGLINDCGRIVGEGKEAMGWFDMSTLKEPYRLEGKKTMGLELAEQFEWRLPDHVFYPTGGGTGLIGMWKAFEELEAVGWLESPKKPRLHACQASGCAPIPAAFDAGERFSTPPESPRTVASGLRVPRAVGDFMILDAVRASGGRALASDDDALLAWMRAAAALEGVSVCPETGACLDALDRCVRDGTVKPDETVVVFNTGAAQKYAEALRADLPRIHKDRVDWERIASS